MMMRNKINKYKVKTFRKSLLRWHKKHRRVFLWRQNPTPYKVLVSEILLQKTNAEKVEAVFKKMISQYSSIESLSKADLRLLKNLIKPLGLLYRAERLKNIAREIVCRHDGKIPDNQKDLLKLKGVGLYIANAVLCFGYGKRYPIFDTNVERVFVRELGLKSRLSRSRTDKKIWGIAFKILPARNFQEFNLALLDYSAFVYPKRNKQKCPGLSCKGCDANI